MTQVANHDKSIPVCHGCGHYTCSDCGAGFPSRDAYLRHRMEPHPPSQGEPAPA